MIYFNCIQSDDWKLHRVRVRIFGQSCSTSRMSMGERTEIQTTSLYSTAELRVCVKVDFIVFNKWIWVEWFITSLIIYLFVMILSRIAKGGDY